jgi:predicted DNA-binding transcriptional regulator AlpA
MTTSAIGSQLEILDEVHDRLGLGWADVAAIVGVNESTVFRWKSRDSDPRPMARTRLIQLQEMMTLLRRLFAGPDLARAWLKEKKPRGLGGSDTPLTVMKAGRIDRVLMLLHTLARGG